MSSVDSKDAALKLVAQAYDKLKEAGISEDFIALALSVANKRRARFFGSFGSDSGCFLEMCDTEDPLLPVKLRFGIRRHRASWWSRIKLSLQAAWLIFRGHDIEYEIDLRDHEIRGLRDLFRGM